MKCARAGVGLVGQYTAASIRVDPIPEASLVWSVPCQNLLRFVRFAFAFLVAVFAGTVVAADAMYTLVEGEARVLRGTTWFKLVPGARALDGDIVVSGDHASVELEVPPARKLFVKGPAAFHAASLIADERRSPAVVILRGWLKAAASSDAPLRLETPAIIVDLAGVAVLDADPRDARMFVESGSAKVTVPAARGKPGVAQEAAAGQFVVRNASASPVVSPRPDASFIAAMPREYRDALPSLASRFSRDVELVPQGEITLAEAEPWLVGANRRIFVKRFTPRLSDPAFRAGVIARASAFPEWDRIVRPERYRPRDNAGS